VVVGVDVLRVGELDALLARPWFVAYVYADEEWTVARGLSNGRRGEFLAGRFAAKEAVLKVLRRGLFSDVAPRQIVVTRQPDGSPLVRLDGNAGRRADELGIGRISVSIAHKGEIVFAAALGMEREDGCPRNSSPSCCGSAWAATRLITEAASSTARGF